MLHLDQFPKAWRNEYARLYADTIDRTIVPPSGEFGTWQGRVFGWLGQDAVTLKGHIHLTPRLLHDSQARKFEVLCHESVHVYQQKGKRWIPWVIKYFLNSA